MDRCGVPLIQQFERRASVKPAPSQSANLSRKALDSKRQNLEPRPERGAGRVLLFGPLGGGERGGRGPASFFHALNRPRAQLRKEQSHGRIYFGR